ncbi:hypothetical protein N9154_01430 [Akkermansiaceae bacterium]|nr:hypothetical protein [Akkermansiaceae bacterium]
MGIDNDSQRKIAEERSVNSAPGNATLKDDDYCFSWVYPDPIGVVAVDEN